MAAAAEFDIRSFALPRCCRAQAILDLVNSFFLALPLAALNTTPNPQLAARARLDRFIDRTQAYVVIENRKRGGEFPRFDPEDLRTIAEEFEANRVDPILGLAVAAQESRFQRSAKSGMGARGIFQFMPKTAKWRGVDPADVRSSARGAARYLEDLRNSPFYRAHCKGDLSCALYHYNAGPNAKKGLRRPARYARQVLERARKIAALIAAKGNTNLK